MPEFPLAYFDHAATSFPKPPAVGRAMQEFLASGAVNPGRSGFDLAVQTGRLIEELRARLCRFFGNPTQDPDRTVFTANATDALNLAIQGTCRRGDHVVATVLEHNSVLRPLQMLQERDRLEFDLACCDSAARVRPESIAELIRPNTRLVVMTHASNVFGTIQPIAQVGALCRKHGIVFLLDAAQSAGLLPIDMEALGVDLLAVTGHKSLQGPTGTGCLLVGDDVPIRSTRWGGTGVRSAVREHLDEFPWRLEAGTLNTVGLVGLAASLDWLEERGPADLLRHERLLAERLLTGAAALDGVEFRGFDRQPELGLGGDRLPVISLTVTGLACEAVAQFLDTDWNVAVRSGLQCAPLAHAALGTTPEGTVRFSFGPANSLAEVDRAIAALDRISAAVP